jgi:hypothetical protein
MLRFCTLLPAAVVAVAIGFFRLFGNAVFPLFRFDDAGRTIFFRLRFFNLWLPF